MTRLLALIIFWIVGLPTHAIELTSVRSSADQDSSRVVLELSGKPRFSHFNLNNPSRLVLDIANLTQPTLHALDAIDDSRIHRIRRSKRV